VKRYSGTLTIRMHPTLHARLAKAAFARGLSLNRLLIEYLDLVITSDAIRLSEEDIRAGRTVALKDAARTLKERRAVTSRSDIRRRNILAGTPMDEGLK